MRVTIDGKQFALGGERFLFRGVTYGTFGPRSDGALLPEQPQVAEDFAAMAAAGFTVVRTYTVPPADVLETAADAGLHVLPGLSYGDWRHLLGSGRREERRAVEQMRVAARTAARELRGRSEVLGLSLGNEIPADVVRWYGTDRIAGILDELAQVVREEDDELLVTYANFPTTEYLPLGGLDFLTFNVFLERRNDFRRYLTRLHHLAGDRPLVLGEVGLHAGEGAEGEARQAEVLDWQLELALERGVAGTCVYSWTDEWAVEGHEVQGWSFGITRADRSPRPALDVAAAWNARTVGDLDVQWPTISVVICAYNAGATLDECLTYTCALDYPGLEILVMDDGSTDDTAEIARRHPRAVLVELPHAGLSVARNAGFAAASGELVAYLDSDAYPSPEWPYYLALGLDDPSLGGVGGPNVPPPSDPLGAHRVARAPGGPVHVLVSDDRAEHVPGCNMAFYRAVLTDVGGFDPVYTSAGDDVDLCWKVLDSGRAIGFHPAALVWHHRRPGLRTYLKQQRGYGRSEALVEARHPDRFTALGTARWHGRIYSSLVPSPARQRVYRGAFGAAAYQSVYAAGGHAIDIAHQVGVPLAAAALLTAPLGLIAWPLALPAVLALLGVLVLAGIDAVQAAPPRELRTGALRFRLGVALLHLLQPLVRLEGRLRHGEFARRDLPAPAGLPGPIERAAGGVLVLPADRPREQLAADVVGILRRGGLRASIGGGWEDHDAQVVGSTLVLGTLVTSGFPTWFTQVRVRPQLRSRRVAAVAVALLVAAALSPALGALLALGALAELGRGLWRVGPGATRLLRDAVEPQVLDLRDAYEPYVEAPEQRHPETEAADAGATLR